MSYSEFEKNIANIFGPMIGYIAVTNVQGVEVEDAFTYIGMKLLEMAFSNTDSNDSYIIVSDNVTSVEGNKKVIKQSEFGDHVMEYINASYKEKSTFNDVNGFNTYEWNIEKKDSTETSCKIVSTMTIKLDSDFSKLKGYSNSLVDTFMNNDITEQNADYLIKLKVGQKCRIKSNEKVTGYYLSGSSNIELNEEYTEIIAKEVGKSNGYLYIGNQEKKKSIYVIVEENTGNQELSPISILIDTSTSVTPTVPPNNNNNNNNTFSDTTLPKTGKEQEPILYIAYLLIIFASFGIFSLIITGKKK